MAVFGNIRCIWVKLFVVGKLVVFEQNGCNRTKWLYSGKVVVLGQKWLFSGKVVAVGQSGCILAK